MAVMSNDTFWKTFNSKPKTTSGLAGNVQQGQPQTATGSVSGSWSNPARTVTTTDPAGNSTSKQVTSGGYATPPGVNQFPDTPASNLGHVDPNGDIITFEDNPLNNQLDKYDINKISGELTQQPDITSYINQLADAQKKSRIAALDKAKTNALANLDTEQASIEPTYYNKRNQAQANADIGAMNFAQYMAARGIKGNAGAMPEIYRNAGLQSQVGALDQSEAQDFSNIARQRANINNGYESDIANANAEVDSQALQNYIDQWNKNRDYNLDLGQATGNINGTPTLEAKQVNNTLQESQINRYKDAMAGLGNQFDYQSEIDSLKNDGDTSNDWKIPILQQEREKKVQNNLQNEIQAIGQYANDYDTEIKRRQSTADTSDDALIPYLTNARNQKISAQQASQQDNLKELYTRYMDVFKQTGVVNSDEMASVLGVPKGTYSLDYAKTVYDTNKPYYNPNSGSRSSGSSSTSKASPYYNSVSNTIANKIKSYESDPNIVVKDDNGRVVRNWYQTPGSVQYNDLVNSIMNSDISDTEKEQLLSLYNIPY